MHDLVEQVLSVPMVVFALVIWALVWIQRRGLETFIPSIKNKKWWNDFLIPLGPLGTGAILASILTMYPFPELLAGHWTGRAALGLVCGLGSGLVYRLYKKMLAGTVSTMLAGLASKLKSNTPSE